MQICPAAIRSSNFFTPCIISREKNGIGIEKYICSAKPEILSQVSEFMSLSVIDAFLLHNASFKSEDAGKRAN